MLHHSISTLKRIQQIAFAFDCVKNLPLKHIFCPTDRMFFTELRDILNRTMNKEEGAVDELAVMIPLLSEMGAELYEQTRREMVEVNSHNRDMAASHMADAYFSLCELVYAHATMQSCISSAHDIAKNVRQASFWLSNSLEREKFEMIFQQRRAEKHLYGAVNTNKQKSAEIIAFPA